MSRRVVHRMLVAMLALALATSLVSCSDSDGGGSATDDSIEDATTTTRPPPTTTTAPPPVTYTLEAGGEGAGQVTYVDDGEVLNEQVQLPWSLEVVAEDGYPRYSLTVASFTSQATCRIVQAGAVVVEEAAEPDSFIASCSA